jgi:hypothetical protein
LLLWVIWLAFTDTVFLVTVVSIYMCVSTLFTDLLVKSTENYLLCSGFALAYVSEEQGDLLSILFELGSLF